MPVNRRLLQIEAHPAPPILGRRAEWRAGGRSLRLLCERAGIAAGLEYFYEHKVMLRFTPRLG